jgi:hypothetical protein
MPQVIFLNFQNFTLRNLEVPEKKEEKDPGTYALTRERIEMNPRLKMNFTDNKPDFAEKNLCYLRNLW